MFHRSFEKHVVFKTAILLVIFTICQTKSIRHKRDVYCDHIKHEYYVQQMQGCKECDRCWSGQEPDLQGADLGMGLYGATKCPKCRVCSEGTYNPDGDLYWYCLTCTTCSDSGLNEDEPCTKTQDTKCSNTVRAVQERLISTPYPYENIYVHVQAMEKHKDEDKDTVIEVSVSVVVTAVVVLLVVCGIMSKKESMRKCLGGRGDSTPEENMPLKDTETEQDPTGEKSKNEALENPEKADDERKNEKSPPKRTCHVSFGNYDNDVFGSDNDVDKDGEEPLRKRNPVLKRQMSQPCTKGEEKHIQYVLEKEDEKKRPCESFIRYLSKVLAPQKRYKKFAEYMGLEKHTMEVLAEEHEKPHRNLNAEDMSFEYTDLSLQRKQKLTRSDIYNALRKLGFDEELTNILEKRQRCRI